MIESAVNFINSANLIQTTGRNDMTLVTVELEFNENDLGPEWLNPDNLASLLYTKTATHKEFLKILSYENVVQG